MKRVSFKVLLLVRINVYETHENLLSFETQAPFFQPNNALYDFSGSFPNAFAGRVVRNYSYPLSPNKFHLGFINSELYFVGNSIWEISDLEKDLQRTEGVPEDVLQSVDHYRIIKNTWENVGMTTTSIGALTWIGTGIAILILGGLESGPEGPSIANPENVPTSLCIANVSGLFMSMLIGPVMMGIPSPPKKLVETLNNWCCTGVQE